MALLEAMAERQVTADGANYELKRPFFLIKPRIPWITRDFPLPEAQLTGSSCDLAWVSWVGGREPDAGAFSGAAFH